MRDYSALDEAICKHIASSGTHPTVSDELSAIAASEIANHGASAQVTAEPWRLVSQRMAALSESGRIKYERKAGYRRGRWAVRGEPVTA